MGMFGAGPQSYFGFSGAPGGLSGERKASADAYFADLQQQMARRAAMAEARKQRESEDALGNREMSLKELLGASQMREASRAGNLAQARLGLDWNTAEADANQRANALSLQERLGMMSENRMASADQARNQQAGQQLSLQERLGMMSENRLSQGQNQDEAFRRAQLGQQAELARMPYQQQTADSRAQSDFQNRQLGQQDKQFNRQFTDMPLTDRWRTALAQEQQRLDQSNTDRAFNDLSARDRQTGQLEEKRMGMTERLAGNESQLRRDLQGETLKQQLQMWSQLSAAEKQQNQQFGRNLKQRVAEFAQGQQNWQTERDEPSMMQFQDLGFKQQGLDLQKAAQEAEATSRGEYRNIQREGNLMQTLGPYMGDMLSGDPELRERATVAIQKLLPTGDRPMVDPGTRAAQRLFSNQVIEAQKSASPAPKTIQDVSRMNHAAAQTLFDQYQNQNRSLSEVFRAAAESDRNTPPGAESTMKALKQLLREWSDLRSDVRPVDEQNAPAIKLLDRMFGTGDKTRSRQVPFAVPQF